MAPLNVNVSELHLARWQELEPATRNQVRALSISPEQLEYAGTLERAIHACENADPADVAGLAIMLEGAPVGFVVLSRGIKRPDWAPAGSVALTAMRIDVSCQGRGIGKAALVAMALWLRRAWPAEHTIALCVDEENRAGRRAYEVAGYREYTSPRQGRIGWVRYLSKALSGDRHAA